MHKLALLTCLQLGSSLAWMLCHDYVRGGPLLLFRFRPPWTAALASTPPSLPELPTSCPLSKYLSHCKKAALLPKKETDLSIPTLSCITSCLNYHLASPYPERPGPIAAALQYREQGSWCQGVSHGELLWCISSHQYFQYYCILAIHHPSMCLPGSIHSCIIS